MMEKFVYFIRPAGKPGPIKIGCSVDPAERLRSIQRDWLSPLELIGCVPGCIPDEITLHKRFRRNRQRTHSSNREWFNHCPEIEQGIGRIIELGFVPKNLSAPISLWGINEPERAS